MTQETAKAAENANATPRRDEERVHQVREAYGRIAEGRTGCCGSEAAVEGAADSEQLGYRRDDLATLPGDADLGLGCGAPIDELELKPGETVLDLGSGGGIDVFLAARQVGPSGRCIGVDMTAAMLDLARKNAAKAGLLNVEFREGRLEELPVEDGSVDAVTSNCVINLVPDKRAVFREIGRVLRPGGRVVVSDIVLDGHLPEALLKELSCQGQSCITTAAQRGDYLRLVGEAGLEDVTVLNDVDYLAASGQGSLEEMPEESRALLERTGCRFEDVAGKVHSITLRARKRAASKSE